MKKPFVILTGPTAVGKSAAAIRLAKRVGGEIISADSIQVYRYMDIGSAKLLPSEMDGVKHHLIDILDPAEEFHVARFQQMAKTALEQIYAAGRIPIVAGGTGFYIRALLYDTDFMEAREDATYRCRLTELARQQGAPLLHQRLLSIDPQAAAAIHPNNVKRVIRALEFHHRTGLPISVHNQQEQQKESPYNFTYFVLNDQREKLYARIDARVEQMIEQGLVDEVRRLQKMGYHQDMVSMQGLGYKELFGYLKGEYSLDEAVYLIKRDSRHFAKRQLTWFKREKEIVWVEKEAFCYDEQKMENYMVEILRERTII